MVAAAPAGPALVEPTGGLCERLAGRTPAEYLIGGVLRDDLPLRGPNSLVWHTVGEQDFALPPVPNHLFPRDNSYWIAGEFRSPRDPDTGRVCGVEAVVDKDLTAALLAEQLDADALLTLTDVTQVFTAYGAAHPGPLPMATPEQLRALHLPEGSMRPKAEAVAAFVERTGALAAVGPLDDAPGMILGPTGTMVRTRPGARGPGPTARPEGPSALGPAVRRAAG